MKIGALVIGCVVLLNIGFGAGYLYVMEDFMKFKADVESAGKQQTKDTEEANAKTQQTNEEIRNAYDASLRAVLADRERLRSRSGRCSVSGNSASTQTTAPDATGDASIDPAVCVETGVMLHYLQQWTREQGMMAD